MLRLRTTLTALTLCALGSGAWAQGGVFVTGHDPDYHAVGSVGAQHIIQAALNYVTNNNVSSILLVTDTFSPGGDNIDSRLGMTAAGFTFAVADDGTAG